MTYARLRTLTGGTYTTGIGLDWSAQFEGVSPSPIVSRNGEIDVPSLTRGVCADYAVRKYNPTDVLVWIEATVGSPVQYNVNGVLTEISASAEVTISLLADFNTVRFVRDLGPLNVVLTSGVMFEEDGTDFVSLYAAGDDPLSLSTGSSLPTVPPSP